MEGSVIEDTAAAVAISVGYSAALNGSTAHIGGIPIPDTPAHIVAAFISSQNTSIYSEDSIVFYNSWRVYQLSPKYLEGASTLNVYALSSGFIVRYSTPDFSASNTVRNAKLGAARYYSESCTTRSKRMSV